MANSINLSSLSSRRRSPIDMSSYEVPLSKKQRKMDKIQSSTSTHIMVKWANFIQPYETQKTTLSPSVSSNLPPVAAKVYKLRSRTISVERPPDLVQEETGPKVIQGEMESKVPDVPETAARTVPYVRDSKCLYDFEEIIEEVQPLPLETLSSAVASPVFFPPLDEEVIFVPCSPEESLRDLKRLTKQNSVGSSSSFSSPIVSEDEILVPETPPQS